jgi:hypothetical protein
VEQASRGEPHISPQSAHVRETEHDACVLVVY